MSNNTVTAGSIINALDYIIETNSWPNSVELVEVSMIVSQSDRNANEFFMPIINDVIKRCEEKGYSSDYPVVRRYHIDLSMTKLTFAFGYGD